VPGLRWKRGLRVVALAAVLISVPVLARDAIAQRSARVQASAYVTISYLGARLLPDAAGAAGVASPQPTGQRLRLAGLGVLDVQTGPGEQVRIGAGATESASRSAVVVEIAYVST
jgi:hypothetical protein